MGLPAHTYSPVFKEEEFDSILKYSSHITFNSLRQYEKYSDRIKEYSGRISAGLRINPEFSEISHSLYNPSSPGSRLGVSSGDLEEALPGN